MVFLYIYNYYAEGLRPPCMHPSDPNQRTDVHYMLQLVYLQHSPQHEQLIKFYMYLLCFKSPLIKTKMLDKAY